ncbi:YnaM/YnfT family protein [Klebsiella oxytoca]
MTTYLVTAALVTLSGLMVLGLLQLWEGISNNHDEF